ncbi:MAG: HEPN domain-containing protein [Candidatus Hodarchaeales archaeon]
MLEVTRKQMKRHKDWYDQAKRDLTKARKDLENSDYEWASFTAQQAAEKAVKALLQYKGQEKRGHGVSVLLKLCEGPDILVNKSKRLDFHYIPTRYPDAFPTGKPADYYTKQMAEEACLIASEIINYCRDKMGF